jgi:hypothetical protein
MLASVVSLQSRFTQSWFFPAPRACVCGSRIASAHDNEAKKDVDLKFALQLLKSKTGSKPMSMFLDFQNLSRLNLAKIPSPAPKLPSLDPTRAIERAVLSLSPVYPTSVERLLQSPVGSWLSESPAAILAFGTAMLDIVVKMLAKKLRHGDLKLDNVMLEVVPVLHTAHDALTVDWSHLALIDPHQSATQPTATTPYGNGTGAPVSALAPTVYRELETVVWLMCSFAKRAESFVGGEHRNQDEYMAAKQRLASSGFPGFPPVVNAAWNAIISAYESGANTDLPARVLRNWKQIRV